MARIPQNGVELEDVGAGVGASPLSELVEDELLDVELDWHRGSKRLPRIPQNGVDVVDDDDESLLESLVDVGASVVLESELEVAVLESVVVDE